MDDTASRQGLPLLPLLPVVALGGSAGSIKALRSFLASLPPGGTGLAYVVVLHLSARHESTLAELLQAHTPMPVLQVQQACEMEPDTVYVIPPGKGLGSEGGMLRLSELPRERHRHHAVDVFLRCLAASHGPRAVAVILSGADRDGAVGIRAIRDGGGLAIVQDPEQAEFDRMPRSAIATGMADWVLPVEQIGARILQHHARAPEQAPQLQARQAPLAADLGEDSLRDVLAFLRVRTGRDLLCYKRATVLRRIARRMQVNNVPDLPAYLDCLRTLPGESAALLQDLLISGTNFFRDAECFAALQARLPALFEGKRPSDAVRVWVAACASGEEAYSVAMLLTEYARTLEAPPAIQVFATDLDHDALHLAREGRYPSAIEADVGPARLQQFFTREHGAYRVRRELREMVLFAAHDVLSDSPFSRLDLVTCRNLLVYLQRPVQQKVLDTFGFALQAGGLLFLGASESVGQGSRHFDGLDPQCRIYQRRALPSKAPGAHAPASAARAGPAPALQGASRRLAAPIAPIPLPHGGSRQLSWAELHYRMLEAVAPPTVLIDTQHEIVHLSATAGRFLQFPGGEPSRNLLRAVHADLRGRLRAAIHKAAQNDAPVHLAPKTVQLPEGPVTLHISVSPAGHVAPGHRLVAFRAERSPDTQLQPAADEDLQPHEEPLPSHVETELERLKSQLRDTVEQYEASTEELKASNEELQSMNEELRSATEELETSRQELQSINEELHTVNSELKSKVDELGQANSDMHNLMDATAIATVFLDRELRITRFTPSAVRLFSLIPADLGRPLSDLKTELDYPGLSTDARRVLENLAPLEREVGTASGGWNLVRLLPYRTQDDRIAGVVLAFIDITEHKNAREALRLSDARFTAVVNQAAVGVLQAGLDGRIFFCNAALRRTLRHAEAELLGRPVIAAIHPDDRPRVQSLFVRLVRERQAFEVEARMLRQDGSTLWMFLSMSLFMNSSDAGAAVLLVCTDITERKWAEDALRRSEEGLRLIIENAVEYAIFTLDATRRITSWNVGAERLLGYDESEAMGRQADMLFTPADREAALPAQEQALAAREGTARYERLHMRKDGSVFWGGGALMTMRDHAGAVVGFVKILRDQSSARETQAALERGRADLEAALHEKEASRAALEAADVAKDRFLAVLSHELRNPLASVHSSAQALLTPRLQLKDREHAAQVVHRQANVMKGLLDELLDISRLRVGRLVLQRRTVDLAEAVQRAVDAVRPAFEEAQHTLELQLPSTPVLLHADPLRLSQILTNLLANAARYTPEGGHISLHAQAEGRTAVIEVQDNGIGMAPAEVESMFEMFLQGAADGHRSTGGLGIGLALVRRLVELHGGQVVGSSEGAGRGSRFVVRLPMAAPQAAAVAAPARLPAPSLLSGPTPQVRRLLVADDNADAAWSISKLLEIQGFEVHTAAGGLDALGVAEAVRPQVAVLDLDMPDLTGYEVARRLRALPWGREMQLIAASGWGQGQDREAAAAAGFDAHLVKPVELADLLALLVPRKSGAAGP
ncbi:chemotaxis protein CheB [Xylophilus rhododendri]|nr:chemotaxis protein CheB [Xylophilus rhododendri]